MRVLNKQEPIRGIAEEEGVSRKFLYQQGHIYPISVGTIKNRMTEAVEKARNINQAQDLSEIERN